MRGKIEPPKRLRAVQHCHRARAALLASWEGGFRVSIPRADAKQGQGLASLVPAVSGGDVRREVSILLLTRDTQPAGRRRIAGTSGLVALCWQCVAPLAAPVPAADRHLTLPLPSGGHDLHLIVTIERAIGTGFAVLVSGVVD